ncbi:hypothetical protein [Peribacillus deserti]|uniref:Uncharacterized protein n=1 Tax=Peribacillus deserti TaxID=673318 RepID=A0A2N5M5Y6_9BACI|nr:hypothetical protein [Peribacillus deserti]PLT29755.1 hypothetical protein CUU66_11240 [Peribacillus deserti]
MFVVHYYENKDLLLSQLRQSVPEVGDALSIKGKKGKVSEVQSIDERRVHVHVVLDKVIKNKSTLNSLKRPRR